MYAVSIAFRDPPQFFLFLQAFEYMLSGGEKHVKREKATELANDNENNREIEKSNLY